MLIREHTSEAVKVFDYITHQVHCTQRTVIQENKTLNICLPACFLNIFCKILIKMCCFSDHLLEDKLIVETSKEESSTVSMF